MQIKPFLKTMASASIFTFMVACSPSSEKVNPLLADGEFEKSPSENFSLREPEQLAIYSGELTQNGRTSHVTLTLIGSDQYTLEEVYSTGNNTMLNASTGTYSFSEVDNPTNPSLVLDILTLKGDLEELPIYFLFLENDSFRLIEDMNTYTGDETNTLKKEEIDF